MVYHLDKVADGVMQEIHEQSEKALFDADQTLSFMEAEKLFRNLIQTIELRKEFSFD